MGGYITSSPRSQTFENRLELQHQLSWVPACQLQTLKSQLLYPSIYLPTYLLTYRGFPGGSDVKKSACNAGDPGSIPGQGRFPGEGNRNPRQYSCLENSMDRGVWQAVVHGVAKSRTQLSN